MKIFRHAPRPRAVVRTAKALRTIDAETPASSGLARLCRHRIRRALSPLWRSPVPAAAASLSAASCDGLGLAITALIVGGAGLLCTFFLSRYLANRLARLWEAEAYDRGLREGREEALLEQLSCFTTGKVDLPVARANIASFIARNRLDLFASACTLAGQHWPDIAQTELFLSIVECVKGVEGEDYERFCVAMRPLKLNTTMLAARFTALLEGRRWEDTFNVLRLADVNSFCQMFYLAINTHRAPKHLIQSGVEHLMGYREYREHVERFGITGQTDYFDLLGLAYNPTLTAEDVSRAYASSMIQASPTLLDNARATLIDPTLRLIHIAHLLLTDNIQTHQLVAPKPDEKEEFVFH